MSIFGSPCSARTNEIIQTPLLLFKLQLCAYDTLQQHSLRDANKSHSSNCGYCVSAERSLSSTGSEPSADYLPRHAQSVKHAVVNRVSFARIQIEKGTNKKEYLLVLFLFVTKPNNIDAYIKINFAKAKPPQLLPYSLLLITFQKSTSFFREQ